jgi:hypothetical protein
MADHRPRPRRRAPATEIVWDYQWSLSGIATFPTLPDDIEDRAEEEVALAYLVRGVFNATIAQGDIS